MRYLTRRTGVQIHTKSEQGRKEDNNKSSFQITITNQCPPNVQNIQKGQNNKVECNPHQIFCIGKIHQFSTSICDKEGQGLLSGKAPTLLLQTVLITLICKISHIKINKNRPHLLYGSGGLQLSVPFCFLSPYVTA